MLSALIQLNEESINYTKELGRKEGFRPPNLGHIPNIDDKTPYETNRNRVHPHYII